MTTSKEQYIRDYLANDAQLKALVGDRIYSETPPSVKGSYIYFFLQAELPDSGLNELSGLVETHYQFDCWSPDPQTARALRDRVKKIFGPMSNSVISQTKQNATSDLFDDSTRDMNAMVSFELTFCCEAPTPYG